MKNLIFLFLSLSLCFATGCTNKLPPAIYSPNTKCSITNVDSVTLLNTTINEGRIVVTIKAEFSTISLNDFYQIAVQKQEANAPHIVCDLAETQLSNGYDPFLSATLNGEIRLVFLHESFTESENYFLFHLLLQKRNEENGTENIYRFALMSPSTK